MVHILPKVKIVGEKWSGRLRGEGSTRSPPARKGGGIYPAPFLTAQISFSGGEVRLSHERIESNLSGEDRAVIHGLIPDRRRGGDVPNNPIEHRKGRESPSRESERDWAVLNQERALFETVKHRRRAVCKGAEIATSKRTTLR